MSKNSILITKASGKQELFSEEKLRRSLRRSKASPDVIESVIATIGTELKPGMSTHQLYQRAFSLLKSQHRPTASRYSLKRAMMALGPEGHLFERFISTLFAWQGYETQVGVIIEGHCVSHEVDVVAQKPGKRVMVECKFHNLPGTKSDVKVALYVHARFEDIRKKQSCDEAWLVTNTALTQDAITFASCSGLQALAWNYPSSESLESLIEESGHYPITCLSLSTGIQKRLLDHEILLCSDLLGHASLLNSWGMSSVEVEDVLHQASTLCQIHNPR